MSWIMGTNHKSPGTASQFIRSSLGIARTVGIVLLTLGVLGIAFMGTTILESIFFGEYLASL